MHDPGLICIKLMESLAPILTPKVMKFKSEFQQELQMGITGIWYMIDFRSASPTPCDSLLSQLFVSPWAIDNLHKFMLIAVNLCKWGWSLYNISSMTSMSKLNFVIREDRMKATAGFRLCDLRGELFIYKGILIGDIFIGTSIPSDAQTGL